MDEHASAGLVHTRAHFPNAAGSRYLIVIDWYRICALWPASWVVSVGFAKFQESSLGTKTVATPASSWRSCGCFHRVRAVTPPREDAHVQVPHTNAPQQDRQIFIQHATDRRPAELRSLDRSWCTANGPQTHWSEGIPAVRVGGFG